MVQIEDDGSLMDNGNANIACTESSDTGFHQQLSTVCLPSQQPLYLFNDIPKWKQIKLPSAKRDAGQNTDPIKLTTEKRNDLKMFVKMLCLLVIAVTVIWKIDASTINLSSNKAKYTGSPMHFPNALMEAVRGSFGFANKTLHKLEDETCQAENTQKIMPAYPILITRDRAQIPKMNISRMLEDKGLGHWSSIFISAREDKEFRWSLYNQQCKSKVTAITREGDEFKIESGFHIKSRFDTLHGLDTMGTCKFVNTVLRNQSWECWLLVALEELKKDLKTLPLKAFDKLIQTEHEKLKTKPSIISDLLKLIKAYFELESVITSGKTFQNSIGICGITNVFNSIDSFRVHLRSLPLWKAPEVQAFKAPIFEDSPFSRRLLTEDAAYWDRYNNEDSKLETGMKNFSQIVKSDIGYEPFNSPPFLPVNETVEDDQDDGGPASNFTHDFTSLGLQGDSSQRPAKKAVTGSGSDEGVDSNGRFLQGIMTMLFAAAAWVVTAAVTSCYTLTDYCLLSIYVLITAVSILITGVSFILRKAFSAGYKLTSHIIISVVLTLLFITLTIIAGLPQGICRLKIIQYMETVLLKLLKHAANKTYLNLRIIQQLSLFAVLFGNPELPNDEQEIHPESDSGLREFDSAASEEEETYQLEVRPPENKKTDALLDRPDEYVGACGGLPEGLIHAQTDPDSTEHTDRFEVFELRKTLSHMGTGSNFSIDSVGYNELINENRNLHKDLSSKLGIRDADAQSSWTNQVPAHEDSLHQSSNSEGTNFMKLEIGPTIKRHLEKSTGLKDEGAEAHTDISKEHLSMQLISSCYKVQQNDFGFDIDELCGKSIGSGDDTNKVETTVSGCQGNQNQEQAVVPNLNPSHGHQYVQQLELKAISLNENSNDRRGSFQSKATCQKPSVKSLEDPDAKIPKKKQALKDEDESNILQGDHETTISQTENNLQGRIPITGFRDIETESRIKSKDKSDTDLQTHAKLDVTLLHGGCKSEKLLQRQARCRGQRNVTSPEPGQVSNLLTGEPATHSERKVLEAADERASQLLQEQYERLEAVRMHDAAPPDAHTLYFPSYDGEVLALDPPPTEYFDERLVVDILHPPKRKYQWQSRTYITGSFHDMMNFLLGIESAVHGSGVILKWSSPLNIKDNILHNWIIAQHSEGHRNMCFDTISDVVYFDEKIELRRFLEVRRRYEMYIDRQENDIQKLKIYGVTKSVEDGQHYVHILYEFRKIVDNIRVFITHSASCCGGQNTHKIFTVPKGSKVKEVLLLPQVEALKEKILVEHPHLKDNMYVKLRVCGCSWYPSPITRLNYNCMLQLVDSLTYTATHHVRCLPYSTTKHTVK